MTLAELKLRRDARFMYEHNLNITGRYEVRIKESQLDLEPGKTLPHCIAGAGASARGLRGPQVYLAGLDDASSWDTLSDSYTMADILRQVMLEDRPEVLRDKEKRWQSENAVERATARERARGVRSSSGR